MCPHHRRTAFTLIELLVVIFIIGLLIALLLPAVQAAREAGRRTTCQNHLGQIGKALQLYEATFKTFPPGLVQDPYWTPPSIQPQPPPPPPQYNKQWMFSWMTRILPYIEQQNIHAKIKWDQFTWPNPCEPGADYLNDESIPIYLCPSDPLSSQKSASFDIGPPFGVVAFAFTDYLGVNGTDQFKFDGMLYVNSSVARAAVRDGESNTLIVGERPPYPDGVGGWWFAGSGLFPWWGATDVVLGAKERDFGKRASSYQKGSQNDPNYEHVWHFWSHHPGGAHFVFVDAHVDFIAYNVAPDLLTKLATRESAARGLEDLITEEY